RSAPGSAVTPSASSPSPARCWPTRTPAADAAPGPPPPGAFRAVPAVRFGRTTGAGETSRVTDTDPAALLAAVERLRGSADALTCPLGRDDVGAARTSRTELVDQLDDYVLPRLRSLDAPLLAVVGGSTGAGKSTLVNSVVGEQVTATGVIRPTTRASVLVHHE